MGKRTKEQKSVDTPKIPASCNTTLQKVAANSSYTTESLPNEQPKVVLNNTRRPSRRGFGKGSKRKKRVHPPSELREESSTGQLFTQEIKAMIRHLVIALTREQYP